jgi:regulatory protein
MSAGAERPPRRKAPPPSPLDQAVRFLQIRDHSERELRLKLRKKGLEAEVIDATIERVRGLGYLDEERYARSLAQAFIGRRQVGPRRVLARLRAAGVASGTAQSAVRQALAQSDELSTIRALVAKRFPTVFEGRDAKQKARALRFLLGRGFSPEAVGRVLRMEVDLDDSGAEP